MRLCGRIAPESAAGPVGQLAIAVRPARIAAAYEILSRSVRPGLSSALTMSFARANMRECAVESNTAARGPPPESVSVATSPPVSVALGVERLPASAVTIAANKIKRHLEIVTVRDRKSVV